MTNTFAFEALNQLNQHIPTGIDRPAALVGSIAAGAIVTGVSHWRYRGTHESLVTATTNEAVLEEVIQEVVGGTPALDKIARRQRMASVAMEWLGAGMTVGVLTGGITANVVVKDHTASAAVVVDSTRSMVGTADLDEPGLTRYQAAIRALEQADYEGRMAVVEAGEQTSTPIALTSEWRKQLPALETPTVASNGSDISPGITAGLAQLPTAGLDDQNKPIHQGELVVISDATLLMSSDQLAKLKEDAGEEVTLKVIVPGTTQASYQDEGGQVDSGVTPDVLRSLDQNLILAENTGAIADAISETIEKSGTTHSKKAWYDGAALGGLVLLAGMARNAWQRSNRVNN